MNHGRDMYHFGSSDHARQQFDTWLHHVLKQDGSVKSIPAPHVPVVHIPDDQLAITMPIVGQVLLPLRWVYGCAIILALIIGAPLLSQHFGKFLYIIFALSIIVPGFELVRKKNDTPHMRGVDGSRLLTSCFM